MAGAACACDGDAFAATLPTSALDPEGSDEGAAVALTVEALSRKAAK